MNKLRIAFVDSWLQAAAQGSGTAVAISGLGRALQAHGHHVERLAPLPDRLPITLRRLRWNLTNIPLLRRSSYDLVVGFDIDGSGFALLPNKPYICSIKGVIAEERRHERGRVGLLFAALAKLEGWNARRAQRVLTTSEYCRRMVMEHYHVPHDYIGLVPEGIELTHWDAVARAVGERNDPRPTILCVARQYHRKHVDDLVSAAALLRSRLPTLQLRVVGDGPEHSNLVAQVERLALRDTVTFLQDLPYAALVQEYLHADLFCLPSRQEGFGIVFLEAMAAGKPVVSTSAAAIPEIVIHGATGILVTPGDVQGLAGALYLLLTDHDLRTQYGQAGRQRVEGFTWQHSADLFLSEVAPLLSIH